MRQALPQSNLVHWITGDYFGITLTLSLRSLVLVTTAAGLLACAQGNPSGRNDGGGGNGTLDYGETCDDGNTQPWDSCGTDWQVENCGHYEDIGLNCTP